MVSIKYYLSAFPKTIMALIVFKPDQKCHSNTSYCDGLTGDFSKVPAGKMVHVKDCNRPK